MISIGSFAQSYSGNVKSDFTESSLSYGNVDIYKGDSLVASVLTDKDGNFNIPLNIGNYRCEINYAGHKTIVKEINVEKDEIDDVTLESKPEEMKAKMVKRLEYAEAEESISLDGGGRGAFSFSTRSKRESAFDEDGLYGSGDTYYYADDYEVSEPMAYDRKGFVGGGEGRARSGALTAGEINDFAKWKMWQDLAEGELASYQESWELRLNGRFSVLLQSSTGLPLADAIVQLMNGSREVIFTSRTDNTGRAELWASLYDEVSSGKDFSISVTYGTEDSKFIRKAKPIGDGINYVTMDVACNENNVVDIAFVVDATGSMGDELHYLQAEMNDVIYKSKSISDKLNFHFANVFYRDKGDEYETKTMDFDRVLSKAITFIDEQSAGGGGDYPEAVEAGLDEAINKLSWNESARSRIIFLILDAPPHNNPEVKEKIKGLINTAAEKGIRIVPVGASGINKATEYLMRSLALGTNGTYTFLTNHSGIGNNHIEPSTDSYKVETFNDVMVRILKSYTYMPDCQQNIPELNLEYPDSTVALYNEVHVDSTDSIDITRDTVIVDRGDTTIHNGGGIKNDKPNISWKYYPNPTNGIVNIEADVDIDELYITDLSGKLLQLVEDIKKDRAVQVDLSAYTTGIYLIRYQHEEHWITGKIVLVR